MSEHRAFWEAIRIYLDGRRWSWLAARIGVSRKQLESWRRGIPRLPQLRRIAAGLGMTPGELLDLAEGLSKRFPGDK